MAHAHRPPAAVPAARDFPRSAASRRSEDDRRNQTGGEVRECGDRVAEEHHSETRSNQIGVQPLQGKFCGVAQETVGIGECAETLLRNRKHGSERSTATRRPEGPTARASSMARDPQPQPTSITVVPTTGAANASSGRVTGASIASRRSCSRVQNSPSIPFQRVRCCSLKVCAGVISHKMVFDFR